MSQEHQVNITLTPFLYHMFLAKGFEIVSTSALHDRPLLVRNFDGENVLQNLIFFGSVQAEGT